MWKNLGANVTGLVGAALENVQKMSSDFEAQLDAAVAEDENANIKSPHKKISSKSQSSISLSTVEGGVSTVNKASSESALSSLSTGDDLPVNQSSPSKTKVKKLKPRKKTPTSSNSDMTSLIKEEEDNLDDPPDQGDNVMRVELQQALEEMRLAEQLLKTQHEDETASAKIAAEAAASAAADLKKILDAEAEAEAIRLEKIRKEHEEAAVKEKIRHVEEIESRRIAKEEAERVKAKEKAAQKMARDEAKKAKLAADTERKAQEEAMEVELREERKKEALEKKRCADEKAAAEEDARLELKRSQEVARQMALQEAKEAAALKKQAEDAKMELVKQQQESNNSVSLQHALEVDNLEARLSEQGMVVIELEHKNSELKSLLEEASHDAQAKIDQLTESFRLEEEEWKVHLSDALNQCKKEMELKAVEESAVMNVFLEEQRDKLEAMEEENVSLKEQLSQREVEFAMAMKKMTQQLQADIDKVTEVVSDRERALQTATSQLSELTTSYEDALSQINALEQTLADTSSQLKNSTAASASTADLRKEIAKLQESLEEKEESLSAFRVEGQALAKKQSDMEKNVRNSRKEVKEKELEIKKLTETKEQYVKTIEEMQDIIRANENSSSNTQKHMSVMQAVSQASQDKLLKLEAEVSGKTDELAAQRKALESSWGEISELKKLISELKAEKDDLLGQLGAGANKVVATESTRRDLEQREAILRATNKQLQDSLQRQMSESVAREERMRDELNDTRKRWQEAVTSRESLASEVSGVTTPLLRQISSLQESLRIKSEGWQKIESTLTERAIRAENIADSSEKRRNVFEEEIRELKISLKNDTTRISDLQHEISELESTLEKKKRLEVEANERIAKLQKSLNEETATRISLEDNMREVDSRHRRAIHQIREEKESEGKEKDIQIGQLRAENSSLSNQLHELNVKSDYDNPKDKSQQGESKTRSSGSLQLKTPAFVAGTESSFVATERNNQQIVQRDEKIDHLLKQIQQTQMSRDALLEEVSYLSSKLSEYEELLESLPAVKKESKLMKDQNNALLLMLGEKEEELESTLQDMQDMKQLYKTEIMKLLNVTDEDVTDMTASVLASC